MIDYNKVRPGDRLRIVGMGAHGYASLGDIVTVTVCTPDNHGQCTVVNDDGEHASFVLTCGAQRLELVEPDLSSLPKVQVTLPFRNSMERIQVLADFVEMLAWRGNPLPSGWLSRATLVYFDVEGGRQKAVFTFSFNTNNDAVAFDKEFNPS